MIELILLFFLFLLATVARYIVFGAFEPVMFAWIFLLPAAALILYIISKRFADKELSYQPKSISEWSFYTLQKSFLNKKPLFNGNEQRGYIKRYFSKKWQYVISDVFGFNWYLSLEIQIDQEIYHVIWYRQKWFSQQEQWKIYQNGELIGEAHTLFNLKNTAKLKEAINFILFDKSYTTSATTVTKTISLTGDEELFGTLKPNHMLSNVQVIEVKENLPKYLIPLIIHSYYFKHK